MSRVLFHARPSGFGAFARPLLAAVLVVPGLAWAQAGGGHDMHAMPGPSTPAPTATDADKMQGMDHGAMDHSKMQGMDHGAMDHSKMQGMDHGAMDHSRMQGMDEGGMDMKSTMDAMQGGSAPPDARDPDAYSNGLALGHMPGMDMADDALHAQVLLDRFEAFSTRDSHGQALDGQAWVGGDIDKLWLKVDGSRTGGKLDATRTEALWNHAFATYWGLQTGVRHDFGGGPGRTWAAFGVQGLAPYWFGLQATAYVGEGGRTAARFEADYDLLLTQRLVLQPDVKVDLYGRDDPDRAIGAGLSDFEAGLRLRYEVSRKVAPYIGLVASRKIGSTADLARAAGDSVRDTRLVAGLRIWF